MKDRTHVNLRFTNRKTILVISTLGSMLRSAQAKVPNQLHFIGP